MPRLAPLCLLLVVGVVPSPLSAQSVDEDVDARTPRFLIASNASEPPARATPKEVPALLRRVSLSLDGATIGDALAAIATQSRLELMYSDAVVPRRTVHLKAESITVAAALTEVLVDTDIDVVFEKNGRAMLTRRPGASRAARAGMIAGTVTDAKTGKPVGGVEVFLERTQWRTASDSVGHYRLIDIDAGSYTLTARRLGYIKASRQVTIGAKLADTIDLAVAPAAVKLNELVTTATGQQRRRDLGNAITTIKADSVLRTAPIRNLTDLLQNRVPGLTVQHTSGAPGDPARLRLRGLGSVMRGNDPVVIVDGIRVYAAQSEARSGNLTNLAPRGGGDDEKYFGTGNTPAPSPLDQIDPNTIETIEVFKGPSAATLYGADAANGVIVITTKRGKPGPTRWQASLIRGQTGTLGEYPIGYYPWGHSQGPAAVRRFCPTIARFGGEVCVQDSLARFQALNVPSLTVLGRGRTSALSLTASGGSQALTYSVTGTYRDEVGGLKLPAFEVERFRANFNREAPDWMRRPHRLETWGVASTVEARLGATASVTLSSSIVRERQQRTSLENQLAALSGTYIDTINGVYYRAAGSANLPATNNILQDYYLRHTASSVNFKTGLNANWRPLSWWNASGQAGVNIDPRNDESLLPAGLVSLTDSGHVAQGTGQVIEGTFNLQSNLSRPLRWGFRFETSVGANLTTRNISDVAVAASGLFPGTKTITGASRLTAFDDQQSTSVFGWYIEPRISGQRLSLSTGIRLDGGSAYGTRVSGFGGGGLLALPKLNGSWVISEEPWFPFNGLFSSLRLRGAYGQAQVQPGAADRLRLYRYSTFAAPSVVLTTLGNTRLRPERSTEFEGGFDADLLDSRLSLEATAYRKTQVDALMPVTLPKSVGGGGSVLTNIGTVRNTGVELTLSATPVRSAALTWSSQLTYSSNRNELVALGAGVEANRAEGLVAGYPVGGRWARPIVGYNDANGDGILWEGEVLVGDSAVFLGRLYPAYTMALHSGVTLLNGAIQLSAAFSYDAGASQIDETARTNWVLSRALADPSTPLDQQAAVLAANTDAPWRTDYGVIQEVSTLRFRSFSVSYRAPAAVARLLRSQQLNVALQGDNLALHSTYRGKDPDVTAWSPTERIVDTGQLAQPTTWQLRVDIQY